MQSREQTGKELEGYREKERKEEKTNNPPQIGHIYDQYILEGCKYSKQKY